VRVAEVRRLRQREPGVEPATTETGASPSRACSPSDRRRCTSPTSRHTDPVEITVLVRIEDAEPALSVTSSPACTSCGRRSRTRRGWCPRLLDPASGLVPPVLVLGDERDVGARFASSRCEPSSRRSTARASPCLVVARGLIRTPDLERDARRRLAGTELGRERHQVSRVDVRVDAELVDCTQLISRVGRSPRSTGTARRSRSRAEAVAVDSGLEIDRRLDELVLLRARADELVEHLLARDPGGLSLFQ